MLLSDFLIFRFSVLCAIYTSHVQWSDSGRSVFVSSETNIVMTVSNDGKQLQHLKTGVRMERGDGKLQLWLYSCLSCHAWDIALLYFILSCTSCLKHSLIHRANPTQLSEWKYVNLDTKWCWNRAVTVILILYRKMTDLLEIQMHF